MLKSLPKRPVGWIVIAIVLIILIGLYIPVCRAIQNPKPEEKPVPVVATTATPEETLKAAQKEREDAKATTKLANEEKAMAATIAAEAKKDREKAEADKKTAETINTTSARLVKVLEPYIAELERRPHVPSVSAKSLLDDLSCDNSSSVNEVVTRLSHRLDAIPDMLTVFATGDALQKKRIRTAIRQMDGARTKLSDIAANPEKWEAKIVGAARQILIEGFYQDLKIEDCYANMERFSEQIRDMASDLNAKTQELDNIKHQLQNLAELEKCKDAKHARESEGLKNELLQRIAILQGELKNSGVKVYATIQVPAPTPAPAPAPAPTPTPQFQMVYPYPNPCSR